MERENKNLKVHGVDGYNKICKNCREFFWANRSDKKYCGEKCKNQYRYKRDKRKALIQGLLAKFGLGTVKSSADAQKETAKKLDYARLTFILSFIGFLGSVGFYLGVLREVYSPERDKQKIEQLQQENKELEKTIMVLIEKEAEHEEAGK
ncbi:MAG: hypothetical protein R2780_01810 [Crocinitomicaceae bacterium]